MVARGRHFEDFVVLSVYFKRAANSAVRANGISRYLALRIPVWGLSEIEFGFELQGICWTHTDTIAAVDTCRLW